MSEDRPSSRAHDAFDRTAKTLDDILRFGRIAADLVARGREAYDADEVHRLAAEAILHKVGEAIARLARDDAEFVAAHPEVSWRLMKAMRNRIAHDYDVVDYDLVWNALQSRLPREIDRNRVLAEQRRAPTDRP